MGEIGLMENGDQAAGAHPGQYMLNEPARPFIEDSVFKKHS
jgi:hypothetical protein